MRDHGERETSVSERLDADREGSDPPRRTRAPRRQENKDRTREAIRVSALDLFDEVGFERTTVDEIAARARIGRRTFFRYFSCKEAVLFGAGPFPDVPRIVEGCLARGMTPLDAVFHSLREQELYPQPATETDRRRRRIRLDLLVVPSVREYYRSLVAELADGVSDVIRLHPEHGNVPYVAELVGGLVELIIIDHVDSGATAHFDADEQAWRRALQVALGS